MELSFHERIQQILEEHSFLRFDTFIIEEMGYSLSEAGNEKELAQIRHQALLEFRKRTNRKNIATMPTMRRWFGMGTYRRPGREQVYEICFALRLDRDSASRYLTKGLGEPSFQINDYQEIIYLYGLENRISFEDCQKMIQIFEENMDSDISFVHTHNTKELLTQYEGKKGRSPEEFLQWMGKRAEWFKGYSKTTLDYLSRIRSRIIQEIRRDAKCRLEDMLREAGYFNGRKQYEFGGQEDKYKIPRFVNSYRNNQYYKVSERLGKNILELYHIVYNTRETNTGLREAIYSDTKRTIYPGQIEPDSSVRIMSGKYLSDLFHIPEKKEQRMRAAQALRALSVMREDRPCPEEIKDFGMTVTRGKGHFGSVAEAREELVQFMKKQKRRCLQLQRGDLLPMVLYIAQSQYSAEHGNEYQMEDARNQFLELANALLNACSMEPVNERYELDVMLLACFQPEEMYTYSDLLDAYYIRQEETEREVPEKDETI